MKREDFKIGQLISFAGFRPGNRPTLATVILINNTHITFSWQDNIYYYGPKFKNQTSFDKMTLCSQEDLSTFKQEKINRKIKHLWNNSRWVQRNPTQAY